MQILRAFLPVFCCLAAFSALAAVVHATGLLAQFDEVQVARMHAFAASSANVQEFFERTTNLGAGPFLAAFAIALVVAIVLTGELRLALLCSAVMFLSSESNGWLKEWFSRPRPVFVRWSSWSFPSGHAQGSMAVYGLAIYLCFLRWPHSRLRWVAAFGFGGLILSIGLSRMMLGVHYFTDVVAGFLMGMAWVGLVMAVTALFRPSGGESRNPSAPSQ